jgi:hypothetical protein
VTALIIEPTSKQDAARVLAEAGGAVDFVSDGEMLAARLRHASVAGPSLDQHTDVFGSVSGQSGPQFGFGRDLRVTSATGGRMGRP